MAREMEDLFHRFDMDGNCLARNGDKVKNGKPTTRTPRHQSQNVFRCAMFVTALLVMPSGDLVLAQDSTPVSEFILRPGVALEITIWPDDRLGGQFPIEDSGMVYLPLLGPVYANGLGLGEFRAILRDQYAVVMQSPVVTVTPFFEVGILGGVRQPGLYEVVPTQGVFSVISEAGGFTDNAKTDEVRVFGDSGIRYLDAELMAVMSSTESIQGLDPELTGLRLQANDRIIVPEGASITTATVLSVIQSLGIAAAIYFQLTSGN